MRLGRFIFNERSMDGYTLWLVIPRFWHKDAKDLISITHDTRSTILPYTNGAHCTTVCINGGINGGGLIWRFENYAPQVRWAQRQRELEEQQRDNYRGTGLSKAEVQRGVNATIGRFVADHPTEPVPAALINWVDNIATDEDVAVARRRQEARNAQ